LSIQNLLLTALLVILNSGSLLNSLIISSMVVEAIPHVS
jgi:hypothetical protein